MMMDAAQQLPSIFANPLADVSDAAQVDDLTFNRMAMDAARAHAQARELEELACRLISELPDDELPCKIAQARDNAATIECMAQKIDRELQCARTDPRTGRKQINPSHARAISCQLGHMLQAVSDEKAELQHISEQGSTHKTKQTAHLVETIFKPEEKPLTTKIANTVQKVAKAAGKSATGGAAAGAAVHLTATQPAEPITLAQVVGHVRATVSSGVQKARSAAAETLTAVKQSDTYRAVVSFGQRTIESARTLASDAWEGTQHAAISLWGATQEHVIAPVQHGLVVARDAVVSAGSSTAHWFSEAGSNIAATASSAKQKLVALMPWAEKAPPVVIAKVTRITVSPTPIPASRLMKAEEGVLCRAMKQAAAIGLPLAVQGQGLACQILDISAPAMPNLTPVLSSFLGAP